MEKDKDLGAVAWVSIFQGQCLKCGKRESLSEKTNYNVFGQPQSSCCGQPMYITPIDKKRNK